jgi:glycosyltransferase involved in cell wall biosynthesis
MNPEISIVMPCYNREIFLRRVLDAYDQQLGDAAFEIIAVDDGSTDATPSLLTTYQSTRYMLRPLVLDKNAGPANARNRGIALAQAPLVMFVGDDILPSPDFVQQHLNAHREYPAREWAILGKTVWPDDLPQNTLMRHIDGLGAQQFSYYYMHDGDEMDFRHFYTSNISLKTSLLHSIQPWFDTNFRYAAYEDVDLGYRMGQQLGMRIMYTERPLGAHYHYYTIWGFTQRQYRCGLMSAVFIRKYPHLRRRWQFWRPQLYAALSRVPDIWRLISKSDPAQFDQVEELVLHLASFYELTEAQPLDRLYLVLLNYFLYKGMFYGDLAEAEARRACNTLQLVSLNYHICDILQTLQMQHAPYPEDICRSLLALLPRYETPSVQRVRRLWGTPYFNRLRRRLLPSFS